MNATTLSLPLATAGHAFRLWLSKLKPPAAPKELNVPIDVELVLGVIEHQLLVTSADWLPLRLALAFNDQGWTGEKARGRIEKALEMYGGRFDGIEPDACGCDRCKKTGTDHYCFGLCGELYFDGAKGTWWVNLNLL